MPDTSKPLFQITPRDWREHDEVIARSTLGTRLIASKGALAEGSSATWRRLFVEVEGDPADAGVRDAVFYALGIGRPQG